MKKIFAIAMAATISTAAFAQDKGKIETFDFNNFKLHVYNTNDVMADASYIVECR